MLDDVFPARARTATPDEKPRAVGADGRPLARLRRLPGARRTARSRSWCSSAAEVTIVPGNADLRRHRARDDDRLRPDLGHPVPGVRDRPDRLRDRDRQRRGAGQRRAPALPARSELRDDHGDALGRPVHGREGGAGLLEGDPAADQPRRVDGAARRRAAAAPGSRAPASRARRRSRARGEISSAIGTRASRSSPASRPTCTWRPRRRSERTEAARGRGAADRVDRDVRAAAGELADPLGDVARRPRRAPCSAPSSAARASGPGATSTATTRAPSARPSITADSPTPPQPWTASQSPARTPPRSPTAANAVMKRQPSAAAASKPSSVGERHAVEVGDGHRARARRTSPSP